MGVLARKTSATDAYGKIVWSSCLPTLGSSLCVSDVGPADRHAASAQAVVAKKPGTPGRARIRRQTIAQGMPAVAAYLW